MMQRFALLTFAIVSLSAPLHLAAQTSPGIPQNVQAVVNASGTTLTVSWTAPPQGAGATPTGYVLDFTQDQRPVYTLPTGTETTVVLSIPAGLAGRFAVSVRAVANGVSGQGSNQVTFELGASGPCTAPPSPPAQLRYSRVGSRLELRWNEVFRATEYIIEAGSSQRATDIYVGSAGTATSVVAVIPENLRAFVRVRARNACGLSLFGDEIEIGALWSVSFRPGLNVDACLSPGQAAPGGICSQVMTLRGSQNQFDELWNPYSPFMRARGTQTPSQFTAVLECLNGAASGTMQATWNGERYVGTATLGSFTTNVRITPGNFDPQCEVQ
jgi:hypothetical protein